MRYPELESLTLLPAPVLSVYLDINPASARNQSHPPGFLTWLRSQARDRANTVPAAEQKLFREMVEKVEEQLKREPPQGRGYIAFAGPAVWEQFVLQVDLPDQLEWGPPELTPLVWLLEEQRPCGLVLLDRTGARFFRYVLGELHEDHEEALQFDPSQWRRKDLMPPAQPGVEQVRGSQRDAFEHRIEAQYVRFLAQEAGHLQQWVQRHRLPVIFVAGPPELTELLWKEAPKGLQERLVRIPKDLAHNTLAELRRVTAEELQRWEQAHQQQLLTKLMEESNGTQAVLGLARTLEKLQQGLAREVVLARGWDAPLSQCDRCQWADLEDASVCSACGGPRRTVSLLRVLPALTRRYKATLEILAGTAAEYLRQRGGIGARLR